MRRSGQHLQTAPQHGRAYPEKPHSHASTDRTSARSQNPRSAQRRAGAPPGRAARGGPQGLAQDGGVLQRAGSRLEWELGVDSHLAALNVLERRLGAAGAGQGNGVQGEGGSRVPPALAITLPVAADTCGDQRWRWSGRMDRQRARCPSAARKLNLVERQRRFALQPDLRDMHKGKVLCAWPGPTPQVGARAASSPESSVQVGSWRAASFLSPAPRPTVCCMGLGHVSSPDCPWGLPVRFWPVLPWSCLSPVGAA